MQPTDAPAAYRIFRPCVIPRPGRESPAAPPAPPRIVMPPPPRGVPAAVEHALVAILARAPEFGETIDGAFQRKEREVATLIVDLAPGEARALLAETRRKMGAHPATRFGGAR